MKNEMKDEMKNGRMKNEGKDSMKIFELRWVMTLVDYSAMTHHCLDQNLIKNAIIAINKIIRKINTELNIQNSNQRREERMRDSNIR